MNRLEEIQKALECVEKMKRAASVKIGDLEITVRVDGGLDLYRSASIYSHNSSSIHIAKEEVGSFVKWASSLLDSCEEK